MAGMMRRLLCLVGLHLWVPVGLWCEDDLECLRCGRVEHQP